MLVIRKGDLLEAKENILCQQVNEYGTMDGGLALQIAKKYPHIEQTYKDYCKEHIADEMLGNTLFVPTTTNETQWIASCFTQLNFITQYDLLEKVFKKIKDTAKKHNWTIGIPYKFGCGIADGEWDKVEEILINIFDDYDIYIYKLEVK